MAFVVPKQAENNFFPMYISALVLYLLPMRCEMKQSNGEGDLLDMRIADNSDAHSGSRLCAVGSMQQFKSNCALS